MNLGRAGRRAVCSQSERAVLTMNEALIPENSGARSARALSTHDDQLQVVCRGHAANLGSACPPHDEHLHGEQRLAGGSLPPSCRIRRPRLLPCRHSRDRCPGQRQTFKHLQEGGRKPAVVSASRWRLCSHPASGLCPAVRS